MLDFPQGTVILSEEQIARHYDMQAELVGARLEALQSCREEHFLPLSHALLTPPHPTPSLKTSVCLEGGSADTLVCLAPTWNSLQLT